MTRRNVLKGAKLNLCHAVLAVAVTSCLAPHAAFAQSAQDSATYNIPAGDLASAVDAFSRQSGLQILYKPELLARKRARSLEGTLSSLDALDRLIEGSGVRWERVNATTYVLKEEKKLPPKKSMQQKSLQGQPEPGVKGSSSSGQHQDMDTIVVVGSRLGTSPVESAMPIKVLTREDIDRSGAGNIAQALSYLSEISLSSTGDRDIGLGTGVGDGGNTNSSTVQMRGLDRGTTLVLINGRRAGDSAMFSSTGQFDLSTIPLALVDRIEVLPAGSSAVYGGDGLAGVINVVLSRDASGLELRVRKTIADGYDRETVSGMWGKAWDKGNITLSMNWNRNSALFGSERAISADQDFRRFGGYDYRDTAGFPTIVYSLDGCPATPEPCWTPPDTRAPLPGLNQPIATAPLGPNGSLTVADFTEIDGEPPRVSRTRHLISPETNRGLNFSGRIDLTSRMEGFSELTYTERDVPAYQLPLIISGETGLVNGRLEADHPFNPFGVPVGINYYQAETGVYAAFTQRHIRGLLGLRGKLGRFDWEVTGMQSRDKASTSGGAGYDSVAMAAALADTNPETAINPFINDGSSITSPERLRSLFNTSLAHDTESRGDVWTGFVRGPLLHLAAGDVQALLGVEHQRQEILIKSNDQSLISKYVDGVSKSKAIFAEFRVPILSARDGSSYERVAVTGAARRESSDRYEDPTQTKTFGIEVRPTDRLLLRSTYSTAFRPLLAYSAIQDELPWDFWVRDPKFPEYEYGYAVTGISSGGVPTDLIPETSETITMGALYRPSADWSLSITHWSTKFRDRIAYVSAQTLVDNEQFYSNRVTRDPVTGLVNYIDNRQVNISRNDSAGVDIAADTSFQAGSGYVTAGLAATYTYKHETQLTDDSPTTENVGVRRYEGWAPRWKVVPRIGWQPRSGVNTTLVARYISKYEDSWRLATGPDAGKYPVMGNFWITDFNADLALDELFPAKRYLAGTRLMIGANNVFNTQPDFCMGCGGSGYDAGTYDIVGRSFYAELRWSF